MSNVIATGTSEGKYEIAQNSVKKFVYELFSGSGVEIDRLISVFDNSSIKRRHFSMPIEWFGRHHSFAERNELFVENAINLSLKAIEDCINIAGMNIEDIDSVIFVSTTGLSTPSIDAMLLNKLNFKEHIKRTPIWGLGCAGGAVGLSRAMDFTKAYPKKTSLVVALELCSLTFQKNDLSKSNIVACSLFSDGAAATLVVGNESKFSNTKGIELIDSLSTTYYDSLDVMGWEIIDDGFKVLFRKDIPKIVSELVKPNIEELLCSHGLTFNNIKHYITHPGGYKVINAYENSIGLKNGKLKYSRKVLNEHGNMSSPTVMFVLKEFLENEEYLPDEKGLISSLGPGFSSELLLFKTR
jgi:alkylresorcinol/alkylpyrone synthase